MEREDRNSSERKILENQREKIRQYTQAFEEYPTRKLAIYLRLFVPIWAFLAESVFLYICRVSRAGDVFWTLSWVQETIEYMSWYRTVVYVTLASLWIFLLLTILNEACRNRGLLRSSDVLKGLRKLEKQSQKAELILNKEADVLPSSFEYEFKELVFEDEVFSECGEVMRIVAGSNLLLKVSIVLQMLSFFIFNTALSVSLVAPAMIHFSGCCVFEPLCMRDLLATIFMWISVIISLLISIVNNATVFSERWGNAFPLLYFVGILAGTTTGTAALAFVIPTVIAAVGWTIYGIVIVTCTIIITIITVTKFTVYVVLFFIVLIFIVSQLFS